MRYYFVYIVTVIIVVFVLIGNHNQEKEWLSKAPEGSHLEWYPTGPSYSSSNRPKIIFPNGQIWYPDIDPFPEIKK